MRGDEIIREIRIAMVNHWVLTKDGQVIAQGDDGELIEPLRGQDITDLARVTIAKKEARASE